MFSDEICGMPYGFSKTHMKVTKNQRKLVNFLFFARKLGVLDPNFYQGASLSH
jgi:hypothetical protein